MDTALIDRLNRAVSGVTGETVTYNGEDLDAVLVIRPERLKGTLSSERVGYCDVPCTALSGDPVQGDRVVGEDGRAWLVDRWDSFEGMFKLVLRFEPAVK